MTQAHLAQELGLTSASLRSKKLVVVAEIMLFLREEVHQISMNIRTIEELVSNDRGGMNQSLAGQSYQKPLNFSLQYTKYHLPWNVSNSASALRSSSSIYF